MRVAGIAFEKLPDEKISSASTTARRPFWLV
jgi:hypothetical protein